MPSVARRGSRRGAGADGASLAQAVGRLCGPSWPNYARPSAAARCDDAPGQRLLLVVLDKDDFAFDSLYDAITASAEANRGRMLHLDRLARQVSRCALPSSVPAVLALNPQKGEARRMS